MSISLLTSGESCAVKLVSYSYILSCFLSLFANSIAGIALPLIVLQTTGSALGAGAVAAATVFPAVIAGLFMGVVIDRYNRRDISALTDSIGALSILALPLVDLAFGLNTWWFVLFGIAASFGDIPGMTARDALLPAIVRNGSLAPERLMGLIQGTAALATILGPALAGVLIFLLNGVGVLWVIAGISALSSVLTLMIPRSVGVIYLESNVKQNTNLIDLLNGAKVLFKSKLLISVTLLNAILLGIIAALQGLILPVYFTLMERPGELGFVVSSLAAGTLIGGFLYAFLGAKASRRMWFMVGIVGTAVGFGIVSLLISVTMVFVGAFVVGFSSGLFGSLLGVLMMEQVPERMRGRIMGVHNSILTAAPPVGIVLASLAVHFGSVYVAGAIVACTWAAFVLFNVWNPSLRNLTPVLNSGSSALTGQSQH